ncbi:MAG: pilus assembly protein [Rhodobacteraceae bacterium]|nr:pilus assembly protein [Paracoccaceae bacterium]
MRFARDDDGTSTIPFALWMPIMIGIIITTMELGIMSIRHTTLERSLDLTVRDVRLGVLTNPTHRALKESICEKAPVLNDCDSHLRLEMIRLDARNWTNPTRTATCVDTAELSEPDITFSAGGNELMFLRACYKFQPLTATRWIGSAINKDGQGYSALVSMSAFVVEP